MINADDIQSLINRMQGWFMKNGGNNMKKMIALLFGLLVFTLGSSTALAMESEISDPRPSGVFFVENFLAMMTVGVVFVMIVGLICWKIFKKRQ